MAVPLTVPGARLPVLTSTAMLMCTTGYACQHGCALGCVAHLNRFSVICLEIFPSFFSLERTLERDFIRVLIIHFSFIAFVIEFVRLKIILF